MKKKLTEEQFNKAIIGLDLKEKTLNIAKGVLVDGKPQTDFINSLGLTKGAISQAVKRVWFAHEAYEKKFECITVTLPKQQAFIVKKWAKDFEEKLKHHNNENTRYS